MHVLAIERIYEQFTGDPLKYQNILNRLPARDRPMRDRVPVQAKFVWEHDDEEWKGGHSVRYDEDEPAIYVEVIDKRFQFVGAWLRPEDVDWENKPNSPGLGSLGNVIKLRSLWSGRGLGVVYY